MAVLIIILKIGIDVCPINDFSLSVKLSLEPLLALFLILSCMLCNKDLIFGLKAVLFEIFTSCSVNDKQSFLLSHFFILILPPLINALVFSALKMVGVINCGSVLSLYIIVPTIDINASDVSCPKELT